MTVFQSRSGDLDPPSLFSRWLRNFGLQTAVTLVIGILVLSPLLPTLVQAFASAPLYEEYWHLTFKNTLDFFTAPDLADVILNTIIFAVGSAVVSVLIGAAAAILVGKTDMPLRGVLGDVFMMPLYLSNLILGIGYLAVYAPGGYVNVWLTSIGLPGINLYSLSGMAIVAGIAQAPIVFMYCLYGSAGNGSSELEDAARSVGAGRMRVLTKITLPLMLPALTYSAMLNLVSGLEMLAIPQLFGLTNNIETLSTFLYRRSVTSSNPNYGLVANAAFVLMILVGLSLYLQFRLLRDAFKFTTVKGKVASKRKVGLGVWRWPACIGLSLYLGMAVLGPILGIILRSLTIVLTPLVPIADLLTTEHFASALGEPRFLRAMQNTVIVGILSAMIGVAICVAVTLVAQRSNYRFRQLTEVLGSLPRALPGIVIGLGVFYASIMFPPFGWLRDSIWILVIAYLMNILPAGTGMIAPALLQIDRDLDRAVRTSGGDWLNACVAVLIPLLKPAIAGAIILLFVASLKSYTIAMFLFTPNTELIGASILLLATDGNMGLACALATVQIIVTIALVTLARMVLKVKIYG